MVNVLRHGYHSPCRPPLLTSLPYVVVPIYNPEFLKSRALCQEVSNFLEKGLLEIVVYPCLWGPIAVPPCGEDG